MKGAEIKKVASRLRWKPEEVKYALDEFFASDTLLEKKGLINICTQSRNPDERLKRSTEHFVNNYEGDLVDLICDLLMKHDPCFQMISLFNIYDYYTGKGEIDVPAYEGRKGGKICHVKFKRSESRFSWRLNFTPWQKSFIHWGTSPEYKESDYSSILFSSVEEHLLSTFDDIAHNPEKLQYKFLDIYIKYLEDTQQLVRLFPEPTSYVDELLPLVIRIVKRVGYLAFNVEAFRRQINYFCRLSGFKECRENLEKLNYAIIPTAKTKISQTERKYLLWWAFVEKLMESGNGVRPSCKKAVSILGESTPSGISRNYYNMKEKAKKKRLSLEKIIKDNYLEAELKELLNKAGITEGDSLFEYVLTESENRSEGDNP